MMRDRTPNCTPLVAIPEIVPITGNDRNFRNHTDCRSIVTHFRLNENTQTLRMATMAANVTLVHCQHRPTGWQTPSKISPLSPALPFWQIPLLMVVLYAAAWLWAVIRPLTTI
jgi:hypothetical protein